MLTPYMLVGEVLKPQGIKGEAKVKIFSGDPQQFMEWDTLFRQAGQVYVPVKARCTRINDGFAYMMLDQCASPEDVERYRGTKLYIDREHCQELAEEETFIADLIGCEGIDENGESIGKLEDVLQYGSVDTWVFKLKGKRMMVPALLRVFPEVDAEHGRISVVREALNEVAVLED